MENCVLSSRRVHSLRGPVVLKKQSSRCKSPRGLVFFDQQRNQRVCRTVSSSLLLRRVSNRIHCSSKHWISNTVKDAIFSAKPVLREQPRIIRMGLGSDTGKDPEAPLSSKTRRSPAWSFSDNLRYLMFYFTSVTLGHFTVHTLKGLKPYSCVLCCFVFSVMYSRQMNWAWISP
jgi:hypothetical protein